MTPVHRLPGAFGASGGGQPVVIFRADASAVIGLGHAMRCRALAEAVVERGGRVLFATVAPSRSLAAAMTSVPADVVPIPGPGGGSADLTATVSLIERLGPQAVVADGYHFPDAYLASLHARCHLAVIDDLADRASLPCDIVLNSSPGAVGLPYGRIAPNARLLLGPAYALLRRDIRAAIGAVRAPLEERQSLLVTFGGSDPLALSTPVVQALVARLPSAVQVVLLVGSGNPRATSLRALADHLDGRVRVLVDPPSVTPVFAAAGLAVAAAGGTVRELAALGVPALTVIVADNQEGAATDGPYPCMDGRIPGAAEAIAERAALLWRGIGARVQMATQVAGLLDGRGALRSADAILDLPGGSGEPLS